MVTFSKLEQAMDFLATNLDGHRPDTICDACLAAESQDDNRFVAGALPPRRDYRIQAIKLLEARHKAIDLRVRCRGQEFPDDVTEFKVGGHNDGHIHIDFIKADGSWRLKDIWQCR
jgi:hypothetical protein